MCLFLYTSVRVSVHVHVLYFCAAEGDIFQSLLCRSLIVLGSCFSLCTINSIICSSPSQPVSPWAIVFPSGVSALCAACHAGPPTVGTGLARPRWDVLAFGHCPLRGGTGWTGRGRGLPPQQERSKEVVPLTSQSFSSGLGGFGG